MMAFRMLEAPTQEEQDFHALQVFIYSTPCMIDWLIRLIYWLIDYLFDESCGLIDEEIN